MKDAVFCDVMLCGSCKNRRFGETNRPHHQGDSVLRLLVTANVLPSYLILVALMMGVINSSESLDHTRVTWRNIPEDGILGKQNIYVQYTTCVYQLQKSATQQKFVKCTCTDCK
jgi:hypothetical protein